MDVGAAPFVVYRMAAMPGPDESVTVTGPFVKSGPAGEIATAGAR